MFGPPQFDPLNYRLNRRVLFQLSKPDRQCYMVQTISLRTLTAYIV